MSHNQCSTRSESDLEGLSLMRSAMGHNFFFGYTSSVALYKRSRAKCIKFLHICYRVLIDNPSASLYHFSNLARYK